MGEFSDAESGDDAVTDRGPERLRMDALGAKIRAERLSRQLSLEAMATKSGVSRSMLSAIERGVKVPTVLVLDRIAGALGVNVSRLLDQQRDAHVIHLRADDQKVVSDEAGWHRKIVSPVLPHVELEMGRIEFEPYVDAGEFAPHQRGWSEYVVVEEGELVIVLDRKEAFLLSDGDALYYESDLTHSFRNPSDRTTIAYILMLGGNGE